jgi:hypothetical protein
MRKNIGLVLVTVLWLSCGSGSQSTCEMIGTLTCQKACACLDGPACQISQGGASFSFETESDCRVLLVSLTCSQNGGAMAYNDANACLPLIQAATCTGTGADAALAYPGDNACDSPP